jgi:hypothetical protein
VHFRSLTLSMKWDVERTALSRGHSIGLGLLIERWIQVLGKEGPGCFTLNKIVHASLSQSISKISANKRGRAPPPRSALYYSTDQK